MQQLRHFEHYLEKGVGVSSRNLLGSDMAGRCLIVMKIIAYENSGAKTARNLYNKSRVGSIFGYTLGGAKETKEEYFKS